MSNSIRNPPPARARSFAFVLYPDSAGFIYQWREKLDELRVVTFVSPLHSPEGEKQHWHVLLHFDSLKSEIVVLRLVQSVFGKVFVPDSSEGLKECQVVSKVHIVNDYRAYARYLLHLDNLEREQFRLCEPLSSTLPLLCNVDPSVYDKLVGSLDSEDIDSGLIRLFAYIRHNHIRSYAVLCDELIVSNELSLFNVAVKRHSVIRSYLAGVSFEHSLEAPAESSKYEVVSLPFGGSSAQIKSFK